MNTQVKSGEHTLLTNIFNNKLEHIQIFRTGLNFIFRFAARERSIDREYIFISKKKTRPDLRKREELTVSFLSKDIKRIRIGKENNQR